MNYRQMIDDLNRRGLHDQAQQIRADVQVARTAVRANDAEAPVPMSLPPVQIFTPLEELKNRPRNYTKGPIRDLPPDIDPATSAVIDYYIAKQYNEQEPDTAQLYEQVEIDFLECNPVDTISVAQAFPAFMKASTAWAWKQFREESSYEYVDYLNEHPNGIKIAASLAPSIEPIEIAYANVHNVVLAGTFFIRDDDVPMVISFNFGGYPSGIMRITATDKNRATAEKFLHEFNVAIAKHNIYKNKNLTFTEGRAGFLNLEPIEFDEVILPPETIEMIKTNTVGMLEHRTALASTSQGIRRSLMTYGPPGNGKTKMFKAVANAADCTVILVTSKAFETTYDVARLYSMARELSPTILMIEDMDLIGSSRHSEQRNTLLGEFLSQMSGAESNRDLITLASTNDLGAIDKALTDRPGRFDRHISIDVPDEKHRALQIKSFLKDVMADLKITKANWAQLVKDTEGFSGSHLEEMVRTAMIKAVQTGVTAAPRYGRRCTIPGKVMIDAVAEVKDNFEAARLACKHHQLGD